MEFVELLAPAKNITIAKAAIQHGADAVYIGAPNFGARTAAANSLEDIAELVAYAHVFHVRVYIAFNTIIYDNELSDAVALCWQLYELGVDALIIQDVGLLQSSLPPIPLHASTQMHNTTVEKVQFLESVGFSQIVLARELSLSQIENICKNTKATIECFVHGAICVCYSGQCYMSAHATKRSGNRGECSQMCRHSYVVEGLGKPFEAYVLSPKDLHLGEQIPQLIKAGVRSFKIEGRLKDQAYVTNITAYFRKLIDAEIAKTPNLQRSSHGVEKILFEPNIYKTFTRGFTDYFINQTRNPDISTFDSPKSRGEYVGKVLAVQGKYIEIETQLTLVNGDGLCFFDSYGEMTGFRVNSVSNSTVQVHQSIPISVGVELWRNISQEFLQSIEQSGDCRKIPITIVLSETNSGYSLTAKDAYGIETTIERTIEKQYAQKPEKALATIETQLQKTGDTICVVTACECIWTNVLFIPISEINEARREVIDLYTIQRAKQHIVPKLERIDTMQAYPITEFADVRLNCANEKAKEFYALHGVQNIQPAFELKADNTIPLMTTKYCIRSQTNMCPKINKEVSRASDISIRDNTGSYTVTFDCARCCMNIYAV